MFDLLVGTSKSLENVIVNAFVNNLINIQIERVRIFSCSTVKVEPDVEQLYNVDPLCLRQRRISLEWRDWDRHRRERWWHCFHRVRELFFRISIELWAQPVGQRWSNPWKKPVEFLDLLSTSDRYRFRHRSARIEHRAMNFVWKRVREF